MKRWCKAIGMALLAGSLYVGTFGICAVCIDGAMRDLYAQDQVTPGGRDEFLPIVMAIPTSNNTWEAVTVVTNWVSVKHGTKLEGISPVTYVAVAPVQPDGTTCFGVRLNAESTTAPGFDDLVYRQPSVSVAMTNTVTPMDYYGIVRRVSQVMVAWRDDVWVLEKREHIGTVVGVEGVYEASFSIGTGGKIGVWQ